MNDLSNYFVSYDTGFLINQKKLEIPKYYDPWVTLKRTLETLMHSERLWEYVDKLPVLSIDGLSSTEQLCYCHSILAMSTSIYVWHRRSIQIPKLLPKSLSVPLRQISEKLGLMPILCHTDMVLANTIIDTTKEISDPRCLVIKEKLMNNTNWDIFQMETARVELYFASIIRTIKELKENILNDNSTSVILTLKIICTTLDSMKKTMDRFNEMDPNYFHTQMRPFLTGWYGESFPYEGGLLYENEDGSTTPIECIGASAGQSPTLQVLDTLFKVKHSGESQTFLNTMQQYMLKNHRDFIRDLPTFVNLQDFIQKNMDNKSLVDAYNECLSAISFYRTRHIQTVTKFIINPAKRVAEQENKSQFLQEHGTGGQNLLVFLKEVRENTNNAKM